MTIGAPVLFKRIQVGQVEDITLTDAGDVMIDVFVKAPNSARLTASTRFWNASGFSINLGGGGASLNVDSLISLLQGGVSFDTVGSDLTPANEGRIYELFPSESAARQNLLADEPGQRVMLTAQFDGSVRGLQPGAAIEFRGIPVGEVTALQAAIVDRDGTPTVVLQATLAIVPARFGVSEDTEEAMASKALDLIAAEVDRGLRAQLATSGLLSQTLFVDLAEIPDAAPATLDRDAEPYPLLPTAPSDTSSLAASAEGLVKRVTDLPLEQVVQSAVTLLANVNALVTAPEIRAAPENLGLLLADARALLNEPGIQQAPGELAAILASVRAGRRPGDAGPARREPLRRPRRDQDRRRQHRRRRRRRARAPRPDRGRRRQGPGASRRPARRLGVRAHRHHRRLREERGRRQRPRLGQRLASPSSAASSPTSAPAAPSTTPTPPSPRSAASPTTSPAPNSSTTSSR